MKGQLIQLGRGQSRSNPITDPLQFIKLAQERGGDGYRIEGNQFVVLRWDFDDSEVIVDRFELVMA